MASLSGFGIRVMLASQNEFGSLPSSDIFWKGLSRIGVEKKSESEVVQSCPTLCDPMDCSLLRLWDFLGKNIGLGCHFLLQGNLPYPGIERGSTTFRQMLYPLSHQGRISVSFSLNF